jgi:hypothetical protein
MRQKQGESAAVTVDGFLNGVDEAPKRLRLRRTHLTVTYVAFLRKRKEFIDAWKKWFNSKVKHGFSFLFLCVAHSAVKAGAPLLPRRPAQEANPPPFTTPLPFFS